MTNVLHSFTHNSANEPPGERLESEIGRCSLEISDIGLGHCAGQIIRSGFHSFSSAADFDRKRTINTTLRFLLSARSLKRYSWWIRDLTEVHITLLHNRSDIVERRLFEQAHWHPSSTRSVHIWSSLNKLTEQTSWAKDSSSESPHADKSRSLVKYVPTPDLMNHERQEERHLWWIIADLQFDQTTIVPWPERVFLLADQEWCKWVLLILFFVYSSE